MFYKGKLESMMKILKKKLEQRGKQWQKEIESSPDKKIIIDLSKTWEDLFFDNIAHVCFGSDIVTTGMKVEIDVRVSQEGSNFERKSLSIQEALHEINFAVMGEGIFKWLNPFYQGLRSLTGMKNFTKYQQTLAENGQRVNHLIKNYVKDRRSGKIKSEVEGQHDIVSQFIASDYFNDDMIADEILDFFGAATLTSQFATSAMTIAFCQKPEILKKVREEFKKLTMRKTIDFSDDPSNDKFDYLDQVVTMETINDFEYLTWVF